MVEGELAPAKSSIHSAAAASSPARGRRRRGRARERSPSRYARWGRARRIGKDADQLERADATPASSRSSRRQPSSTVSPISTKPPGSAYCPLKGRVCPPDQKDAAAPVEDDAVGGERRRAWKGHERASRLAPRRRAKKFLGFFFFFFFFFLKKKKKKKKFHTIYAHLDSRALGSSRSWSDRRICSWRRRRHL